MVSICEVQDVSEETSLKNTKYMAFPYAIYKINDLLPISDEIKEYYKKYFFKENDESIYIIFKYKFDIEYLDVKAFGDNAFISINEAQDYLSTNIKNKIIKENLMTDKLLFLGD